MQEGPHHQGNGEVPPMFTYTNRPVTLKFVDVGYRVKLGNKTSGATEKVILKGVTGIVRQGEMLAMLGPSGSGKTTLLTALGGRLRGHLSGAITYNDKPLSKAMIRNTGFVTQDDILYAHLTVTETLVFTARLRLPRSITKEEKVRQAMSVISLLGLTNCKDNIIGNALVRGVSGGERKRVSIGQEMLINPSLLFLDEPTSGLDSTTAQTIVSTLGKLAAAGRTVVMTIHQPSSRIFYMFHNILLLSNGHPIYYGKSSEALDYFNGVGFGLSVPMNPADFLLDVANGISSDGSAGDREKVNQTLVRAYNDNIANKLKTHIQEAEVENTGSTNDKEISRWSTTWWEEFSVLLQRGVKEKRYSSFSGLRLGQMAFVTLLVGFLWYKSKASNVQDRAGLLFFYTTFWILVPMFQSIFTFPQERLMLTKERSSGMYRLSSYFMATTAGDLPMELVLPTIFITVTYWMAGLKPSLPAFLETLFVLLFCVIVAQGLGLALGALIMDHKAATTLGSICSLTFLLSGSYYVQHAPVFISWIKYISPTHYTYSLLLDSQYSANETYQCGPHKICLVRDIPFVKRVGLGHKTSSMLALCGMLVFFRLLAYLALTRIKATR